MIIADMAWQLNSQQTRENKKEIIYRMIKWWRGKLQAIAMMVCLAYMMCAGIGANNIFGVLMLSKLMQ